MTSFSDADGSPASSSSSSFDGMPNVTSSWATNEDILDVVLESLRSNCTSGGLQQNRQEVEY